MIKKGIGIVIVGLLMATILPVGIAQNLPMEEKTDITKIDKLSSPQLEITIRGGMGIHVYIKNIGTTDVHISEMKLNLDGRVKYNTDSKELTIEAGKTTHDIYVVRGFGPTNIELTLDTITQTASGKILFGFVYGVE